jgi:hypothetical protein
MQHGSTTPDISQTDRHQNRTPHELQRPHTQARNQTIIPLRGIPFYRPPHNALDLLNQLGIEFGVGDIDLHFAGILMTNPLSVGNEHVPFFGISSDELV